MLTRRSALIGLAAAGIAPGLAFADEAAWQVLSEPGAIALMRHALAPGTGDPSNFRLNDCSTQRNLDDRGRAQATRIGQAFRDRSLAFDTVLTSQWCRCRDTADLLDLGPVQDLPTLNSFFRDRAAAPRQTDSVRRFLLNRPPGTRAMLVTHQVNITALTDVFPASGEIIAVALDDDGAVSVRARLAIAA